jgi:D-arabinan exo alpha-(1,3)/(1,5)-arabinofuranosidase (non-reducing end)
MNKPGVAATVIALGVCASASLAQGGGGGGGGRTGLFGDLTMVRDARSRRIASNSPDPGSNADNRHVKPGDTFTLADIKGPGVIRHIWLTFPESTRSWLSDKGCADPSEIVVRMYWDGADQPAVESPLGDFFAAGFGQRAEVNSLPVIVQGGDAYNCYWAMPFRAGAKITVENQSPRPLAALYYQIDYTEEAVAEAAAYFCAQYRQEFPTEKGHDYLIADIETPDIDGKPGGGHYVGTVMSVRSRSPQWFGEGDEKFYIDGEQTPSLWGTGTEDYFSNAWGMEKGCYPYFGVTVLDGWLADLGNKGTMYRWNIPDPVRFHKSLRLVIEHAGWMSADETSTGKVEGFVERDDDFSTVAFWYQRGQPKRFTTLPSAKDRRLPIIDAITEGKDLLTKAKSEGGKLSLQAGNYWTGEGQLFFNNEKGEGAWVEFTFNADQAQMRRLFVPITHSYDFGIYTITLDGNQVGDPLDFYNATVEVHDQPLGDLALTPGTHTIRLTCTGRNPVSRGWKLGVDSVRLRERWNVKREPIKRSLPK